EYRCQWSEAPNAHAAHGQGPFQWSDKPARRLEAIKTCLVRNRYSKNRLDLSSPKRLFRRVKTQPSPLFALIVSEPPPRQINRLLYHQYYCPNSSTHRSYTFPL